MNTIEVEGGATVQFENRIANTSVIGEEALYVENLILQAGSTVLLGDSNIYYCTLIDNGALILPSGAGQLIQAQCDPNIPTVSQWGVLAMALLLLASGSIVTQRRTRSA